MLPTILIVSVALALFFSGRLPVDLVAILMAVALGATGVLTHEEAFSGFSRSPVITIIAICILTAGLERTGITEKFSRFISSVSKSSESRLITTVMSLSAFLSLFNNNIAAASLVLPPALEASRRASVKYSRVAMPLAFGTLLGGMATYFTTTNIIVVGSLRSYNLPLFSFFSFFVVGLPIALVGILYMSLIGKRFLGERADATKKSAGRKAEIDLIELYRLTKEFSALRIRSGSALIGEKLGSGLFASSGLSIVAIRHQGAKDYVVGAKSTLSEQDILIVQGSLEKLKDKFGDLGLEPVPETGWTESSLESGDMAVIEVVLSPRSSLIGRTIREVSFRERYGMTVIAIWRAGKPITEDLGNKPLNFGDALLPRGSRSNISLFVTNPDLMYLGSDAPLPTYMTGKARLSVFIMAIVLLWAGLDAARSTEILLGGSLLLVIFKILTMEDVYRAIEWKTIFLVAGMLPLGTAIVKTGIADQLGQFFVANLGSHTPIFLFATVFLVTVAMTQFIIGPAVATITAPLAIESAIALHLNPAPFAMGVAIATSMAFITPLGHPVNLLVMGPGNYTFRDFVRVGLPLTILLSIVALILIPLVYPLVG